MSPKHPIPEVVDPRAATAFVLEMDLDRLTQDELNYLHKLRDMAQRMKIEEYLKRCR